MAKIASSLLWCQSSARSTGVPV